MRKFLVCMLLLQLSLSTVFSQSPKGDNVLPFATPESQGVNGAMMTHAIDSIARLGIEKKAYPGCVVLIMRNGKIIFEKAYGTYSYDDPTPMTVNSIFDMASVTKVAATTLSVMKLYDEKKIRMDATLGDYLPWVRGSDKENLNVKKIMLHEGGLVPTIMFYRKLVDTTTKTPSPEFFHSDSSAEFGVRVARNLYLKSDYWQTMNKEIAESKLTTPATYRYSDNDLIFMGDIIEAVSGLKVDQYADKNFYKPMGLTSIGFNPRNRFDTNLVAPTELDTYFRHQHLRGDVHDEGAAMFGGVAGHAGLFSSAESVAAVYQMFLNKGKLNGKHYIKRRTIKRFTSYNSPISTRGIGFDKPQRDNLTRKGNPYPSRFASSKTFGHTGYTGTAVWADPKYKMVYVFLSNRVNPTRSNELYTYNIRGAIQDAAYRAIQPELRVIKKWERVKEGVGK
ncbi:MAG: serine hydrolase [Chitinophagaceae bacterium]|nr:serine hydrolase [Chitinophagaceae bacterium]